MKGLALVLFSTAVIIPMAEASQDDKTLGQVINISDHYALMKNFKDQGLMAFAKKSGLIQSLTAEKNYDLYRLGSKINICTRNNDNIVIEKILTCLSLDKEAKDAVKRWIAELNSYEIKT